MLEGKTVLLRTVKESDLAELYGYLDTQTVLSEHQFRMQFYETALWTDEKGTLLLYVQERMVGALWFERGSFNSIDLQFLIFRSEDRKRGYMQEALSLLSAYLFANKRGERLQICVTDYSKALIRLAQKCGFQFEGILRSASFQKGKYLDVCLYSLLRADIENISS